jgi:hypothetical protein
MYKENKKVVDYSDASTNTLVSSEDSSLLILINQQFEMPLQVISVFSYSSLNILHGSHYHEQ